MGRKQKPPNPVLDEIVEKALMAQGVDLEKIDFNDPFAIKTLRDVVLRNAFKAAMVGDKDITSATCDFMTILKLQEERFNDDRDQKLQDIGEWLKKLEEQTERRECELQAMTSELARVRSENEKLQKKIKAIETVRLTNADGEQESVKCQG